MSLKSIRESYTKLLSAFESAGVKLNESQKSDIDAFVLAIESNMSEQRERVIRQTKKLVEAKMEREYKKAFESVMASMQENARLASLVQDKITRINESKKVAAKVDDYLELYVESVLPKKSIVDYDRMQKLEKLHESLKDALVVGEDAVEQKIQQLEESYDVKRGKCETQVAKMQAKLNESARKMKKLETRVAKAEAKALLESKVKDLPSYEARQVRKQLAEATAPEIEKKFSKTLNGVKKRVEEAAKQSVEEQDIAAEAEIEKIINDDDMLTTSPHNGKGVHNAHLVEKEDVEEDDMLKGRVHNGHLNEEDDIEENFETMEEVEFDENGDIALGESEVIDRQHFNMWCALAEERT